MLPHFRTPSATSAGVRIKEKEEKMKKKYKDYGEYLEDAYEQQTEKAGKRKRT